jgi:dihydroxyacetone kinase-like predicted kinase
MIDDDAELVSLYYGADVDEDGANKLADKLADKYEDVEFEVQFGGQPVYSYFISVE